MDANFGRVITAMATPFGIDGELDIEGAQSLASWLVSHGSEALVLSGTTGESPTLTDSEKFQLWRSVKEAVGGVKVLAGATSNSTQHSHELVKLAEKSGADGILAVTPYYSRPPQEGLFQHFSQLMSASELPFVLYDIPVRTGRKIATETVVRLAESHDNLAGLKDAAGDVAATAELLRRTGEGFVVYSGDDSLTLPLVAVGARGVISVASHWAGPVFAEMISCFSRGDAVGASRLNAILVPSYRFQSQETAPNPIPLKAVLSVMGLPGGGCRLPLVSPDGALLDQGSALIEELSQAARKLGIELDESWNL